MFAWHYIAESINSLSPVFDRAVDRILGDPAHFVMAVFAATAAIVSTVAAASGSLRLKDYFNNRAVDRTLAKLDSGPTVLLKSVEDGIGRGLAAESCETGRNAAGKMAGRGNWGYGRIEDCTDRHLHYERVRTRSASAGAASAMFFFLPFNWLPSSSHIQYRPSIIGWQMSSQDPEVAAPLYSGRRENIGIRCDGREFTLS